MLPISPELLRRLIEEREARRRQRFVAWFIAVCSVVFLLAVFYILYCAPPVEFQPRRIITVKESAGLNEITRTLGEQKVIRSPFWFRILVILTSGERGVLAGDYYFENPAGVWGVASRLTSGNFGLDPARITFPEGMTASQMSLILGDRLIDFDTAEFLRIIKLREGYLFPDTYLFMPNTKPEAVLRVLENNFNEKVKSIDNLVKAFKKPLADVVVMASILEAEARTTETRKIISGILWKRLSLGMPLQVDAPFQYIIGKNTFQLTTADLQYDSPYNTYLYKGLPPTAIGNAGLDALTAAVTPVKSPYLFYLSDIRGNMHYATTHDEHLVNKERYLR